MTEAAVVWLADDDRGVRFVLAAALRDAGLHVVEFEDAESVLAQIERQVPDLLFTDVRMAGQGGLKLLERLHAHHAQLPVIVMSAYTDVATTAAAYRHGAFDYLPKPFDLDQAVAAAQRALAQRRSSAPPPAAKRPAAQETELIGRSAAMREVFRAIGRVAASGLNVLITGETGTGKELVARALHTHSARSLRPFVALNTAAIPSELLESELFGHEMGAFTGATRRHSGRFEQADGGTLFLDEIGDMPLLLQTRLLRVLAEGEFYRVGGRELIRADVRVIAATHQDLEGKVARGEFRADLLHRLDVVRIHLPSLRERREDIALLAEHFLARAADQLKVGAKRWSARALAVVERFDWPGNVRQLENLCRRLAVMAPGREIRAEDLPFAAGVEAPPAAPEWSPALRRWAEQELALGRGELHSRASAELERVLLDVALNACGGHRQQAAQVLGLGRNTLTRKLGSSRGRSR
ncbi:MAG: nitrogen regulation protein NR(I) [Lysobacterales bacterium 69-70]|nr:nitrogen regulation protein NR(I) [Xanthomonadaceae bacterium]ODU32886.1 MAG: nitrogen regulation protein NR(I) [Xanthomonadaceae bacterium SCN 69-320]ODV21203.1 MAG: nitrogen regulation protein NR(I) [Xanthomonadaceae bacterium SCN 69-25]OJZ00509.1 MAG: nitrogen regulation protein NR(I) [Xanthomonadales bacterium 69-70]